MPINVDRTDRADRTATITWSAEGDPADLIGLLVDRGHLARILRALACTDQEALEVDQFEQVEILRSIAWAERRLTRRVRTLAVPAATYLSWSNLAFNLTGSTADRSTARSTHAAGLRQLGLDGSAPTAPVQQTVDIVCVSRSHVLTITRANAPHRGGLALPGGRVEPGETTRMAAVRELEEEVGLRVAEHDLVRLGEWDRPGRDPRGPFVSTAFLYMVPEGMTAKAASDALDIGWCDLSDLPPALAFDHEEMVEAAMRIMIAEGWRRPLERQWLADGQ